MIKNNIQRKKDEELPVRNHLGTQLLAEEEQYTGECLFNEANHAEAKCQDCLGACTSLANKDSALKALPDIHCFQSHKIKHVIAEVVKV